MNVLQVHGTVAKVVVGIIATGVILNLAGSGKFGTTAQKAALFVTKGYGV